MKIIIDEDTCTGCGLCVSTAPDVFEMKGELAVVKTDPVLPEAEGQAKEAAENCPVNAIAVE